MRRIAYRNALAMMICASLTGAGCRADQAAAKKHFYATEHTLRSGHFVVKIMDPNNPQRYNHGVRFTPVATVLSARLDGREFFFNPVKHNPITDDGGLASEFDLVAYGDPGAWMPPGYWQTGIGDGFVKIGVGVLRKQAQPYTLFQQLKLIEPAITTVVWKPDEALFHQTCAGIHGYAYQLWATVRVQNNRITIHWKLLNTGSKTFTTRQYTHNFFCFDGHGVGPGYLLHFPYNFAAQGLEPQQRQVGREIRFFKRIPKWVNMVVPWPRAYHGPNTCTLRQMESGQSVTCTTSIPGIRTAIFGCPQYLSPEQFVKFKLAPGKQAKWKRTYQFYLHKSASPNPP